MSKYTKLTPTKLTPKFDPRSTKLLNLTVLQRVDPHIEDILFTSGHATAYAFDIDLKQWRRKGFEGPVFIVERNAQPRHQLIVLNRKSTENMVEDFGGVLQCEVQLPYFLYQNATLEVNGFWFYDQEDCGVVADLFNRLRNAYTEASPFSDISSTKSEFEDLEAGPSSAVMEGPLEPPSTASITNFLNEALNIGNPSNSGGPQTPTIPSSSSTPSVIPTASPQNPNFIRPSVFAPQHSSSPFSMPSMGSSRLIAPKPTAPPLQPPGKIQRPHGAPLLQLSLPLIPPPSLSPTPPTPNYGQVITRDKVRDALLRLVQSDDIVDLVYQEMMNGV